jgi:hypothetical protein
VKQQGFTNPRRNGETVPQHQAQILPSGFQNCPGCARSLLLRQKRSSAGDSETRASLPISPPRLAWKYRRRCGRPRFGPPIMPEVVENRERPIGPTTEDRVAQVQGRYNALHVVSPKSRVAIALARFVRETVTTHVHRHQAMIIGQVGAHLANPGAPTPRKAVNEEDRASVRVPGFNQMEVGRRRRPPSCDPSPCPP